MQARQRISRRHREFDPSRCQLIPATSQKTALCEPTSKMSGKNAAFAGRAEFSGKIASGPGEFRE
jgi:hypothetical protein